MIKKILEKYIQQTKNKDFRFDDNLPLSVLISLLLQKTVSLLRGLKFYNFKQRGKILFFGKSVQLFNSVNMTFGNNVNIGDFVKLSALGKDKLKIGNNVNIGSFSQVIVSTSFNNLGEHIKIGDNVGIGEFSYIGGGGGTVIGKDTIIGQYFSAHPENHNFTDTSLLIREQGVSRKGIVIGKNCWLGSKVTILDGVIIGDGCVVAAGSVVTKSFENGLIIGGVPAKVIKKIGECIS
jgi:acetyltransferase-like isoleucine patch superfamily enzyme